MAKKRLTAFLIRAVTASILLAVYIFICNVIKLDDKGISSVGLSCIFIAAIVTSIYHNITINLLGLDFGRVFDYFVDQTVVFLFVDFLTFMYYIVTLNDDRTFYYDNSPVEKCVSYLCI